MSNIDKNDVLAGMRLGKIPIVRRTDSQIDRDALYEEQAKRRFEKLVEAYNENKSIFVDEYSLCVVGKELQIFVNGQWRDTGILFTEDEIETNRCNFFF